MFAKKGFAIFLMIAWMLCAFAGLAENAEYTFSELKYDKGVSTIYWKTDKKDNTKYVFAILNNNKDVKQKYVGVEVSNGSLQTDQLIPGQTYDILLVDENYAILTGVTRTVPDAPIFEDGRLKDTSVKIKLENREYPLSTKKAKKVNVLSAKKIVEGLKENTVYYGVKYHMQMPQLGKARTFFVTLVFESPDGFMTVERATDVTFDRVNSGYQELWWNITGDEFFYDLYKANERIPVGTYKVHLYWDGMKVNTSTFEVKE